mgnify:CR=1 FL=1
MSSNTLKTLVEKIDPTAIVKIEGPLNDFQAKEISNIIDGLIEKNFIHFIINFSKSNDVNSFGVSVLISIIKSIEKKHGKLLFSNINAHLDKKFMTMGLKGYVKIFDSDKDALASLVVDL